MNDRELDDLIARAVLAEPRPAESPALGRGRYELLEEIMTTPTDRYSEELPLSPAAPLPPSRRRRRLSTGRRVVAGLAVAAAFAAAIAVPAVVLSGRSDHKGGGVNGNPAAAGTAADGSRILLDDPAFTIDWVNNYNAEQGTIRFASSAKRLEINWYPAAEFQEYYKDRSDAGPPQPIEVLGGTGDLFTYNDHEFAVVLPAQGKSFFEIRAEVGGRGAFEAELTKLKVVTADQWLAAMPGSVVKPDEEAAVAEEMLKDIPLPPGFDKRTLRTGLASDYYDFGATVTGAVTCSWLDLYDRGRATEGEGTMAQADQALATSRNWKVLLTMSKEGAYPDEIWRFADAVQARQPVTGYRQSLGC